MRVLQARAASNPSRSSVRVNIASSPSGVRGLLLHRGKQGVPTRIRATHEAHFDWTYPSDQPEMRVLYERA